MTGVSPCGFFKIPGTPPSVRRRYTSPSMKAGVCFPVGRIHKLMYNRAPPGVTPTRMSAVFMAAVLEYLVAEVVQSSGEICHDVWYNRITPRHVQHAIRSDEELDSIAREALAWRFRSGDELDSDDDDDDEQEDTQAAEASGTATGSSPGEADLIEIEQGGKRPSSSGVDQDDVDDNNVDEPD